MTDPDSDLKRKRSVISSSSSGEDTFHKRTNWDPSSDISENFSDKGSFDLSEADPIIPSVKLTPPTPPSMSGANRGPDSMQQNNRLAHEMETTAMALSNDEIKKILESQATIFRTLLTKSSNTKLQIKEAQSTC